ncbi:MAG TPA: DUF2079 domain-containing protein [Acidimicrobiales bacterium]
MAVAGPRPDVDEPLAATTTATAEETDGAPSRPVAPPTLPRWVRLTGRSLLGLQLVGMLVFSTVQYNRYALTIDFANYSQAWWSIAHGHLNPFIAGFGVPFWKNNAEFAMWPLALLDRVYPHPIVLLWLQDVAVVITEMVAFGWIVQVIEKARTRVPNRISRRAGVGLGLGAAVVLVAEPWVYETVAFDFHFEAFAALFVLLVGYDLWAGRNRRLWYWVPLALISSALAGVYLVGVGISGVLAGPGTRRRGAVIGAVGLAWVAALSAVGGVGAGGKTFSASYGYLLGSHHGSSGPLTVIGGALGHPGAVADMAASHWSVVLSFLVVLGLIGVLSPWGCGMAVVVLVPNVLDGSGTFIRYGASFQSWPAMPFVLVGSVTVLVRLLEGGAMARRLAAVGLALWGTLLATFALIALPTLPRAWLWVDRPAAAELARIEPEIPPNAEVVVSLPVMGRFAQRSSIYGFLKDDETVPVNRRQVVFVFSPYQSFQKILTRHGITAATGFVEHRLHGRVLGAGSGVVAVAWSPPPGTRQVTLP